MRNYDRKCVLITTHYYISTFIYSFIKSFSNVCWLFFFNINRLSQLILKAINARLKENYIDPMVPFTSDKRNLIYLSFDISYKTDWVFSLYCVKYVIDFYFLSLTGFNSFVLLVFL